MITDEKRQGYLLNCGFTIIDALVAMVVVATLMSAIAPVMVLSVGNRVQARRIELATQAARTYINGIRSGAIAAPNHAILLSEVDRNQQFTAQRTTFADAAVPPATKLSCTSVTPGYPYRNNTATLSLYCIDFDETPGCSSDSVRDMLVQAYRSRSNSNEPDANSNYLLGIRVYRADAFRDATLLVKSDVRTKRTQATFTGGLGDRKAPLIEMTTETSTSDTRLQGLCDRLGGCQ